MRKTSAVLSALAVLLAAPVAARVDFSGSWRLDAARSTGLPPGVEQSLVVKQDGDTLKVATTLVTDNVDRQVDDVYALGAGEQDVPAQPGITATVSRRTAQWNGERGLEVKDHVEGTNAGGPVTLDVVRRWELSADGRTLTVDHQIDNSGFVTKSVRVFTQSPAAAGPGGAALRTARMFPVDLHVPVPPAPFRIGGRTQLVYEVHATSLRLGDLDWKQLDVLDSQGRVLASYAGPTLAALLTRPGVAGTDEPQRLAPGMRSVAFLWLSLDGAPPASLRHRAVFSIPASAGGADRAVESGAIAVRPAAVVLGPPVRGGDWVARWISNESFHRRGLMAVDGGAQISQRFAIDWNRSTADGVEWTGKGDKNEQYSVFGQEVIAVADAEVGRVVDGIPLNAPGALNPAVTAGIDTAAGNSVALRLPDGSYVTYGHLQPGSIRVKEGQRVRRGEVLARVGNSGNSTGPHLHFHLSTGPALEGEGLPYVFDAFTVLGQEEGPPVDGKWTGKREPPREVRGEMPGNQAVVRFAAGGSA